MSKTFSFDINSYEAFPHFLRIESRLFFPWLKQMLPHDGQEIVGDMVQLHQVILQKSMTLKSLCDKQTYSKGDTLFHDMHSTLNEILKSCLQIQSVQVPYVIPATSIAITSSQLVTVYVGELIRPIYSFAYHKE